MTLTDGSASGDGSCMHGDEELSPAAQDLARTFPGNAWVCTAEGRAVLRRVLLAFSVQNPRIGYCQSMNFLAAALLLALDRSEEKAFWVLVCLIDDGGGHPLQIRSILPFT